MRKDETLRKVRELGLLAVIRGPSPDVTMQMVEALIAGGVLGIEVTYSTPNASDVVRRLKEKYGSQILLGMGTLTERNQPEEAMAAGANFLVSPHCDPDLTERMVATGLVVMAGALTPTEVLQAHRLGSDVVKIFPGSLVGPGYIKALHGPFPHIPMIPTGGVSLANVKDWFAAGVIAVGAGSELCPARSAIEGRFSEITENATAFCEAVKDARRKQQS
jgi:2-dehydro-3-deoxyphosphogluconate aldolase/(4S)-4-hydroxy-2-oxoglutarate aldolase